MSEEKHIANMFFNKIESDPRVTPDLAVCLYCNVVDAKTNYDVSYRIPLDCISGNMFK